MTFAAAALRVAALTAASDGQSVLDAGLADDVGDGPRRDRNLRPARYSSTA